MWVVYLAFWGGGEGVKHKRSASSRTRSLSTTPWRVRNTRKNENKEQKQMKGKENHFVIIYEKEGKEEEERKKEKKKEWNEIGDRWTKADDKKGRCFMIYEISKGIFPWEHNWISLNLRTSWISKKKPTQDIQAEKVSSGTVGLRNLRFSSCEHPKLILFPFFIHDQYNRIIS